MDNLFINSKKLQNIKIYDTTISKLCVLLFNLETQEASKFLDIFRPQGISDPEHVEFCSKHFTCLNVLKARISEHHMEQDRQLFLREAHLLSITGNVFRDLKVARKMLKMVKTHDRESQEYTSERLLFHKDWIKSIEAQAQEQNLLLFKSACLPEKLSDKICVIIKDLQLVSARFRNVATRDSPLEKHTRKLRHYVKARLPILLSPMMNRQTLPTWAKKVSR